jgi:hypothetical protein
LFGTPGTIPHPSPVLVFVDNFVRPKIASREPCREGVALRINQSFAFEF